MRYANTADTVNEARRKREMRKALEAVGLRILEREDEGWHWRDPVTGYRGTLVGIAELWLADAEKERRERESAESAEPLRARERGRRTANGQA